MFKNPLENNNDVRELRETVEALQKHPPLTSAFNKIIGLYEIPRPKIRKNISVG